MGYGLTGGKGYIWLCLPYLNDAGNENVRSWWGDKPTYDAKPTVDYAKRIVPWICKTYGGDSDKIVLCGFSRGAIACNFIGLHDEEISRLWCAFIPYSHYDGVREGWPYPGKDRASALIRLKRLGARPQFILPRGKRCLRHGNLSQVHRHRPNPHPLPPHRLPKPQRRLASPSQQSPRRPPPVASGNRRDEVSNPLEGD